MADDETTARLADELRKSIADRPVQLPAGLEVSLTASVGAVAAYGAHVDIVGLTAEADQALYEAKAAGRNAVVFHHFRPLFTGPAMSLETRH
jgi:diguanylate cyclase (GGDEF)-like protein